MECYLLKPLKHPECDNFFRANLPHLVEVGMSGSMMTQYGLVQKGDLVAFSSNRESLVGVVCVCAMGHCSQSGRPCFLLVVEKFGRVSQHVWGPVGAMGMVSYEDLQDVLAYVSVSRGIRPLSCVG